MTLLSGLTPTISLLELLIDTAFMNDIDFSDEMFKYRSSALDFRYPYTVRQVFTQNMQPDTVYDWVLNGFNGLFTEIRFAIQPSPMNVNNVKTYYKIDKFAVMDQNGTNIIGGSDKKHEESQYIDFPKGPLFLGDTKSFSTGIISLYPQTKSLEYLV